MTATAAETHEEHATNYMAIFWWLAVLTVAELIVRSALERRESRGLHYTLDFPQTDPVAKPTVLTPSR